MGQGMGYGSYGPALGLGPLWVLVLAIIGFAVYYAVKRDGGVKMKEKELLVIAGAVLLVLFLLGGGMMGGIGMGLGLIFWALLIVLAYYLIAGREKAAELESPAEILGKRYAKGEISREEYLRMKKEIIGK